MTAFIDANKDDVVDGRRLGVEPICEVVQVASGSYYAARDRPLSPRAQRDAQLTPRLVEIWKDNYQVYGSRKLWKTGAAGRDRCRPGSDRPVDASGRDPGPTHSKVTTFAEIVAGIEQEEQRDDDGRRPAQPFSATVGLLRVADRESASRSKRRSSAGRAGAP